MTTCNAEDRILSDLISGGLSQLSDLSIGGVSLGNAASALFPINLQFQFNKTEIGKLLLMDVLLSEGIEFDGEVTKYAVEDGSEISDNIFMGGEVLRITGTQSVVEGYSFNLFNGKGRLINVLEAMRTLKAEQKLITVTTGLTVYKDMGIENLKADRSSGQPRDGNWLDISATLRRVKKVSLRRTEIPPERAAADGTNRRVGATNARNSGQPTSTNSATVGQNNPDNRAPSAFESVRRYATGR